MDVTKHVRSLGIHQFSGTDGTVDDQAKDDAMFREFLNGEKLKLGDYENAIQDENGTNLEDENGDTIEYQEP